MIMLLCLCILLVVVFFFNDTATTEIYTYRHTLSLHDALPIASQASSSRRAAAMCKSRKRALNARSKAASFRNQLSGPASRQKSITVPDSSERSEEHTSELQSLMRISYAVFCLKKKKQIT